MMGNEGGGVECSGNVITTVWQVMNSQTRDEEHMRDEMMKMTDVTRKIMTMSLKSCLLNAPKKMAAPVITVSSRKLPE